MSTPKDSLDEKDSPQSELKGTKNNSLALPSFILSVAAFLVTGVISASNIYVTSLAKAKEIEIQKLKNESDQKLNRGQLIFANIKQLNSADPSERELAVAALVWTLGEDEANKLFSHIQQYGPPEAQGAARIARTGIEDARLKRQYNVQAWTGSWSHTFSGRNGDFQGSMKLTAKDDGSVDGNFDVSNGSITGSIQGNLSDDATILTGTWKNSLGQRGNLFFIIAADKGSLKFQGNYSMFDAPPQQGSSTTWNGTKTTA